MLQVYEFLDCFCWSRQYLMLEPEVASLQSGRRRQVHEKYMQLKRLRWLCMLRNWSKQMVFKTLLKWSRDQWRMLLCPKKACVYSELLWFCVLGEHMFYCLFFFFSSHAFLCLLVSWCNHLRVDGVFSSPWVYVWFSNLCTWPVVEAHRDNVFSLFFFCYLSIFNT